MIGRTWQAKGLCFVALLAVCSSAFAQDTAAAEALFNQGVAELEAGRYATACPALQESYRLDPKPGVLFALAECEQKWGKVATSLAHYKDYVGLVSRLPADQQTRHRDRERTAKDEIEKLKLVVPELMLVLAAGAPDTTVVKRDGVVLGRASLGLSLPVDPGEHVITTQVPGGPERTTRVTVVLRDRKRLELTVEAAAAISSGASSAAPAPSALTPAPSATEAPVARGSNRTLAYVAGGIGAAGLLVGTITGVLVFGKKGTVDDNCAGPACNSEGKDAADSGKTLAMVSNISFGLGIAGLATGAILLLTEPKAAPSERGKRGWQPVVASEGATGVWAGVRSSW